MYVIRIELPKGQFCVVNSTAKQPDHVQILVNVAYDKIISYPAEVAYFFRFYYIFVLLIIYYYYCL
jgi:hypothetical protein